MICAFCGKNLSGEIVREIGITPDLDAAYHSPCFEEKERRMRGPLSRRTIQRADQEKPSEPGVGD